MPATSWCKRYCLDKCAPSEFALLEIIAIGCANDGVLINGVVPYGGLAADVFTALAPLFTQLGQELLHDASFICLIPAKGENPPHGRYYFARWVQTAAAVAAGFAGSFLPALQRLQQPRPPADEFAADFYSELGARRLAEDPLVRFPVYGSVRDAPPLNPHGHSMEEFSGVAYLLKMLQQPCDAKAILAAIVTRSGAQTARLAD